MSTRVIGVGNRLRGDDGLGPRVIEELGRRDLPADVELLDAGTAGIGLVGLIAEAHRVVLIDAADMRLAPGTVRVFGLGEVDLESVDPTMSVHEVRVAGALRVAKALDCLPAMVDIVVVQTSSTGWHQGLSDAVESTIQRVADVVHDLLAVALTER